MSSMKPSKTLRSLIQQAAVGLAFAGLSFSVMAQSIVMSSTTSTEQSGLFGYLLPEFKKATGIDIKVVALGTGQALDMARRGDADVVFVHDQPAEEKFVTEGFGLKRFPVMYNDFVVVGPQADPANVKGNDIVAALKKISSSNAGFVSRGDKSGTHAAELRFWTHNTFFIYERAIALRSAWASLVLRASRRIIVVLILSCHVNECVFCVQRHLHVHLNNIKQQVTDTQHQLRMWRLLKV